MEEWIGIIAAILTTGSFVPQVIKVVREKQTAGISLSMYVLFTLGIAFWLAYGIMIRSLPIFLANGVTLVLCSTVLITKIKIG